MLHLTTYHRAYSSPVHPGQVVLFSTRTAASLLVPADLLADIEQGTISEEECTTLTTHGFLVESAEAERREMLGFLDELAALDRCFKPTVVLNLDCNLACVYCFEGSRKGRHYLSEETADRMLDYLLLHALPGRKELGVTFYGGEPLLSLERMLDLAARMKTLCETAGIPFHFSLITNGTLLTRDRVEQLRPLGLKSASVTLDGPRETHDAARPYRNGKGSYDVILRNLRDVADLVDVQIGGNFARENWREFPRLLDDLAAAGLTPDIVSQVRFDPVFKEREGIAPPDFHGGCTCLDEPWLFEASLALREEILRRGYATGRIMPSRCMMDFPNHPVIDHDGALYGCPGLIGREEFKIGNLDGGISGTAAGANWKKEECLACAYLPLCFGGCRYMTLLNTGTMQGVDCRKNYFDAVLEPLVLQDIRYQARP